MRSIRSNATGILFNKIAELSQEAHDSWRCVYINLSRKDARYNRALLTNFVNNAIEQLLSNAEGTIFFCEDNDIFILFQGTPKSVLAKLASHFKELNPREIHGNPDENLFTFLDLSIQWRDLLRLCRSKFFRTQQAYEAPYTLPAAFTRDIAMTRSGAADAQ
jgi:hypothetical protein